MDEIHVWLMLASATSEFHKIQIFYHNISHFTIYISRFFPFAIFHLLFFAFPHLRQPRLVNNPGYYTISL